MSAFWLSFLVGLGVLWLFSWDQFNLRTWKAGRRYGLILTVLTPADLRGTGPLMRTLLVYVVVMTLIYVVMVMLVTAGVLIWEAPPPTAAVEPAAAEATSAVSDGVPAPVDPEPWIPLGISLAMFGLGPRVRYLQTIEEKLRNLAHRFMGVPALLELGSEDIARARITLEEIGDEYVSHHSRERIQGHLDAAARVVAQGRRLQRLEGALLKIFAFRVWVLESRIWPPQIVRDRYAVIEEDIENAMNALFDDLDDLSGRGAAPEDAASGVSATLIRRWETRIEAADAVCDRICALMFVYDQKARGLRNGPEGQRAAAFVSRALRAGQAPRAELDILLTLVLAITGVALVWGYVVASMGWGVDDAPSPSAHGLRFALTAFLTYGPAMLAAMGWRALSDAASEGGDEHGVFPASQLIAIFAASFVVALVCLACLNVAEAIQDTGFQTVRLALPAVLRYAAAQEWPYAALGAVQAAFVARYFSLGPGRLHGWRPLRICLADASALVLCAIFAREVTLQRRATFDDLMQTAPAAGLIGLMTGVALVNMLRKTQVPTRGVAPIEGTS